MRLCICEKGFLYVSNLGDPGVTIINTTNDNLAGQLPLAQAQERGVMDVKAIPQKVYVAPFVGGALQVYNSTTRGYIKSVPIPNAEIEFRQPLTGRVPLQVTVLTGGWSRLLFSLILLAISKIGLSGLPVFGGIGVIIDSIEINLSLLIFYY